MDRQDIAVSMPHKREQAGEVPGLSIILVLYHAEDTGFINLTSFIGGQFGDD